MQNRARYLALGVTCDGDREVLGIFPDDPSLIRLVSMLAIEANDEWLVGRSYISQGSMQALYETRTDRTISPRSEEEIAKLAAA